jgi:lysophospholipase L1-like esterase
MKTHATAALFCLAISLFAADESRLVANLKAGKPQTIVTYGTSLTAGGAWVGQMKEALAGKFPGLVTVINSGQGGMWSKWGVENLEARVIAKKPDTVLIEFGINDAFLEYQTSVAAAQSNLVRMIERIQAANAATEIILMTMNPPIGVHLERRPNYRAYYDMYRAVAKGRKLRLIDHQANWESLLTRDKDRFAKYVPDGIHPGREGCEKMITPEILTALGIGAEAPARHAPQ